MQCFLCLRQERSKASLELMIIQVMKARDAIRCAHMLHGIE